MPPRDSLIGRSLTVLAVLIVAAGGTGIVVTATDDGGQTRTITIKAATPPPAAPAATAVDGPDADTKRDDALPLSTEAQVALEGLAKDANIERRDEGELADPLRSPDDSGPAGQIEGPLAAQEWPGCRTRFVGNFSSRGGVTPSVIVWHQTESVDRVVPASRGVDADASQNSLTAFANSRTSGVSWHFLIGGQDGRCTFTVPLNLNAWTQSNANRFSIGIEVEARQGSSPSYVSGPGRAKLLAVTRGLGKRYGIPMRKAIVTNCRVVRSGILEHSDLGACGGGHSDVTPWSTAPLLAALAKPACDTRCARVRSVRSRNLATHRELRSRNCASLAKTRSARCRTLHHRHAALHAAAKREKIKL